MFMESKDEIPARQEDKDSSFYLQGLDIFYQCLKNKECRHNNLEKGGSYCNIKIL
jgi:hypothetical protein